MDGRLYWKEVGKKIMRKKKREGKGRWIDSLLE